VIICRAEQTDLAQIAELERTAIASPWSRQQIEALLDHGTGLLLVARTETEMYGYAALQVMAPEAELLRIVVAPGRQRQGVGHRLLCSAWQRLEQAGVKDCFLEVRRSNTAARQLYAGHGFAACGIRPEYFRGPREDALVLKKTVTG